MIDGSTQERRKSVARLVGNSEKHMQREPRELIGGSPCQCLVWTVWRVGKKLAVIAVNSVTTMYVSPVSNW